MKKAQGATEYIIIVSIVLIIALMVAYVMGAIPGIGIGVGKRAAQSYWDSTDIAIKDWAVGGDGTIALTLRNNKAENVVITGISARGEPIFSGSKPFSLGQQKVITGKLKENVDGNYALDISITYQDSTGAAFTIEGKERIVGKAASSIEGQDTTSRNIILKPTAAVSYQDEGTTEYDDLALLLDKDDDFGPTNCGSGCGITVTKPYYATGTSPTYFDALALRFDAAGYDLSGYNTILKFYIRDGGYSSGWHHYKIYDQFLDNSECIDGRPPCGASTSFDSGYEGWINVTLDETYLDDGEFSLRIWNAAVDVIFIELEDI